MLTRDNLELTASPFQRDDHISDFEMYTSLERSVACLKGLSAGDAVGKQTETLKRNEVRQWYPDGITGFQGAPGTVIPRYVARRYEWLVGETTDDTEQTIAVGRALITEGSISHSSIGRALMTCRKSNHPDVSFGRFKQRGDPDFVSSEGDGCGAAMRIAPIGIVYFCARMPELIEAAFQACIPTHGGQFAICAAASFAAAVSGAIDGRPPDEVLSLAIDAARQAEPFRAPSSNGNMGEALRRMHGQLATVRQELPARLQEEDCFSDRPAVIVPLAISLALVTQSATETILLAANLGGDADSVASIGGALAAAMAPQTVDDEWYRTVESLNNHNLADLGAKLAAIRR